MRGILSLLLLLQGIPIPPQQGGTISGVLRDVAGKPVASVRVAAVAVPLTPTEAVDSSALASLAETDANGQYRLENIPPGRYYVAAGRLDLPTYYPGTQAMTRGTVIAVSAGSSSTQIDFKLQDTSAGRMLPAFGFGIAMFSGPPVLQVPLELRVDNGEKVPVFGSSGFVKLTLERVGSGTRTTFYTDVRFLQIPGPGPVDYRVVMENLPDGYSVKSMTYGDAALSAGVLRLPASSFNSALPVTIFAPAGASVPVLPVTAVTSSTASPSTTGPSLVLTLSRAVGSVTGARVRGKITGAATRSIFLSGRPGLLFSDGTFEFRGVLAGRHTAFTMNGSPLAASIVVGNSDLDGIELEATPALPVGIQQIVVPTSPGSHTPGSMIPLAPLRGKVVDQTTKEPVPNGMVFLNGGAYGTSQSLREDGTFEFPRLLPGSYIIEVQAFEHETVKRAVVVTDEGAEVEIDAVETPR